MAFPTLQRGTALKIFAGDGTTPVEVFTLICIATTKQFKRSIETDDHMEIDCASPDNLPQRISVAKGKTWDLSISGRADYTKIPTLEAWLDGNPHNVQIKLEGTGAQGGGTWTGAIVLTNFDIGSNDGATVTFSANLKGQKDVAWVAAA